MVISCAARPARLLVVATGNISNDDLLGLFMAHPSTRRRPDGEEAPMTSRETCTCRANGAASTTTSEALAEAIPLRGAMLGLARAGQVVGEGRSRVTSPEAR